MMTSVAAINNLGGYAHNPRGNLWFNDESTYGHKLLTKMGWNKGKGLGKNEDGIKENLKVKYRNTNSGLGFKDDAYANVMKTEYDSILKNLAAEYSCTNSITVKKDVNNSIKEPVQQSKVVKSKLRYPKLFFGKDVSKYSEKDMKSIFICGSSLKNVEQKPENVGKSESAIISDKQCFESEPSQTFDTYSSSLSISDYFAKKMGEKRNGTLYKNSSYTVNHEQTSLDLKNSGTPILTVNENTSKRKQKVSQVDIAFEDQNQVATSIENAETENSVFDKKALKKKKKSQISVKDTVVNSSEIESCVPSITKEDVLGKSLSKNISYNSNTCAVENINQNSNKLTKKRKASQAFENDSVEYSENTFPSEIKSLPTKKKKKKNKKYSETVQLSSENSMCENGITPTEIYETNIQLSSEPVKKRKKSKKKLKEKLKSCLKNKHGSYSLKNVSFNETISYRVIDSEIESVDSLACIENLDENTECYKLIDGDHNNSDNDVFLEDKPKLNGHNSNDDICTKEQDSDLKESDKESAVFDLPSSKSSHYNAWIESQRQALKMQLYKKMLKSIKAHKILKTTNMLSIKGYGNWGYK